MLNRTKVITFINHCDRHPGTDIKPNSFLKTIIILHFFNYSSWTGNRNMEKSNGQTDPRDSIISRRYR